MRAYVPVRGMVKLESFTDPEGVYYPAAEVDDYRRKVAALVEAANNQVAHGKCWYAENYQDESCDDPGCWHCQLKAAIAAVEENS